MNKDYEVWELPVGTLEYFDDQHIYVFNGLVLPSITQILKVKFGNKYQGISKEVLNIASAKGTNLHNAIEIYETQGIKTPLIWYDKYGIEEDNSIELNNYIFLKKHYKWKVNRCEVPIVLFKNDIPIAAGRLDLDVDINGEFGILDIKRTATFDKNYVAFQTNLYRIGYRQTYGKEAKFVGGIHLREEKRKYYKLPIAENESWKLIEEYEKSRGE